MSAPSKLWQCWRCGGPGVRNLGARGYCGFHLAELVEAFDPAIWQLAGIGLPKAARPDVHPLADLECVACGATWLGLPGERCAWCRLQREALERYQRELLLTPPPREPADTLEARYRFWGEQLRRGIATGLLDDDEARLAWRKAVRHVRAA